jgi:flagellar motor switch protein FliG
MTLAHDSLRRVAILVAALDTHSADGILEGLSAEHSAQVRQMIISLGDIADVDEQAVIDDFLSRGFASIDSTIARQPEDGVELYISAESSAIDANLVPALSTAFERPLANAAPVFELLEHAEPAALVKVLVGERPLTIAVVLSRLSESHASIILGEFPDSLQGEVLRCWMALGDADAAVLHEIEQGLLTRLAPPARTRGRHATDRNQLTRVVQAAAPRVQQQILDRLALYDASYDQEMVTAPRLAFDDLEYLNDAGLASMLRNADPQMIVLALAGAAESFVERVARQLPGEEAKHLRRAIESLGPIRLADVESAQQELARLTETLVHQSSVTLASLPQSVAD